MSSKRLKFDCSVFFPYNNKGNNRFLFRLINFGKKTDELKFLFIPVGYGSGFTYSESEDAFTESDIIGLYSEITYHSDGTLLHKFPEHQKGDRGQYKNPYGPSRRRTPLAQLREWEPVLRYTVVDYTICKITKAKNCLVLPENSIIFNGDPFVCTLFLGHMAYSNPPNNQLIEMIYRINDVATNIDLILWIYKTKYQGKLMRIGNSNQAIFTRVNLIEVVEKKDLHS